jgi:hypothetical protein
MLAITGVYDKGKIELIKEVPGLVLTSAIMLGFALFVFEESRYVIALKVGLRYDTK